MSPLSPAVLGGAAVVASPALWAGVVDGTMPLDVALTRYFIAIGICWVVMSLVVELAFPAPGSVRPAPVQTEHQPEVSNDESRSDQ